MLASGATVLARSHKTAALEYSPGNTCPVNWFELTVLKLGVSVGKEKSVAVNLFPFSLRRQ